MLNPQNAYITYMAKYTACKNSKRNWLDTGIRGKSLGTKLDSLPYEERWWCPGFINPWVTSLQQRENYIAIEIKNNSLAFVQLRITVELTLFQPCTIVLEQIYLYIQVVDYK